VVSFHRSAQETGRRKGDAWDALRKQLESKLQEVQIGQLRIMTQRKDWDAAFDLASRLAEGYRGNEDVLRAVAGLMALQAKESIQNKDYSDVRRRLIALEDQFPNNPALEGVRKELRQAAAELLTQAQTLANQGQTNEAIKTLERARGIYRELPGLQKLYLELNHKYPILRVGVQDLPVNLLPGKAVTDSEKQAVELVFESLVKLSSYEPGGQRYEPGLARDLPQLVPLGRRFQLTRNAFWFDGKEGKPVSAADVKHTVQLLRDARWPGYVREWADLFEEGVRLEGDAYRIKLTTRQGLLDPLSMMDFKVLPQKLDLDSLEECTKHPIGSGPYHYVETKGGEAIFAANPYYEARAGNTHDPLPSIREIRFFHSTNPVNDFLNGRLQLLLDLPTRTYKELRNSGGLANVVTLRQPQRNRRIYFLAVNHGRSALKNEDLRRALAHGINREEILKACFREGLDNLHRPLDGPYPPGSWACRAARQYDPYNADLAKACVDRAKTAQVVRTRLTLKYPAAEGREDENDPVYKACNMIRNQLLALDPSIDLALEPRTPRELYTDVESQRNYDLAYYHWDYNNEAYWLWPLFDQQKQAGSQDVRNFLGYQGDVVLDGLFHRAMAHRYFPKVKEITHEIHAHLYAHMPLIPLWQLDTHIAYHNNLELPANIDPLLIFTDVEKWRLEKR
jgi:ABC-type oligopeptide transport system substrate-binding subunit